MAGAEWDPASQVALETVANFDSIVRGGVKDWDGWAGGGAA
jgi:hypothetical protein